MKRLFLTLAFTAFLASGLVSCTDDAAEVSPGFDPVEAVATTDDKPDPGNNTRP